MSTEQDIRDYIESELLEGGGVEFENDTELLAEGTIDSLGLMRLLTYIQDHFRVDLTSVGQPDDFRTVATLAAAIRRHGAA